MTAPPNSELSSARPNVQGNRAAASDVEGRNRANRRSR